MLGGVCGGLAEYLEVDSTAVRVLWVISALLFGFGFILYIAALLIIPKEKVVSAATAIDEAKRRRNIGIIVVVVGAALLIRETNIVSTGWLNFRFVPWRLVWPLVLIGAGIYLLASGKTLAEIFKGLRRRAEESRLHKERRGKMVFGVCAGLGSYFRLDPTVIRLLLAVAVLVVEEAAILTYLALAVILPYGPQEEERIPAGA